MKNDIKLLPSTVSKYNFFNWNQNCLKLLNSQTILIGISNSFPGYLVKETLKGFIFYDNIMHFGKENLEIQKFLIIEDLNCVVYGDISGRILQYDLNRGNSNLKLIKIYGKKGNNLIQAMGIFKTIVAFAGIDNSLKIIDINKRRFVPIVLETSVEIIHSIHFCTITKEKVFLCVVGESTCYKDSRTDVFDVTKLVGKLKIKIS